MKTKISIITIIIITLLYVNIVEAKEKKVLKNNLRNDLNGQLLKAPNNNAIYWIDGGMRRHITSPNVFNSIFAPKNVTNYPDISLIPTGKPITGSNRLIRCNTPGAKFSGYVFFLDNGKKRHVISNRAFQRNSFNWSCIIDYNDCAIISSIPTGSPIK